MRAFLAVTVAEPALQPLRDVRDSLRADVDGVRWARPDGLHITLRFFAVLDDTRAGTLIAAVGAAAGVIPPFDVELGGLGAFPGERRPRVLWMGISRGAAELTRLFSSVDGAVAAAGLDLERRAFAPHCTLGRPRQPWPGAAAWDERAAAVPVLPPFRVHAVDLYESRDGYHVIASAPLAGR